MRKMSKVGHLGLATRKSAEQALQAGHKPAAANDRS
eukprot:COSAG02_NODE_4562_length_5215_cov_2.705043_5_plen_36_part_00